MVTTAIDFDEILKDVPKGAWVAISSDQSTVVAYGSDLAEVIEMSSQRGEKDPIVTKAAHNHNALAF